MSCKYECDRCKSVIKSSLKKLRLVGMKVNDVESWDLCEECQRSLLDWVNVLATEINAR